MVDVLSLLQALNLTGNKQSASAPVQLDQPRVGGVDENGAWSGLGKNNLGAKPKSGLCYRKFSFSDKAKSVSEINKIERECKKGISEQTDYLFTLPLEQGSKSLSDCLSVFRTFAINCGLEGVFAINTRAGEKINMFTHCGRLSEDLVETWCSDLSQGIVTHTKHSRHSPASRHL